MIGHWGSHRDRRTAGEPIRVGKTVRSDFQYLILTATLAAGLVFGQGPAVAAAEEQMEVPDLAFPSNLDTGGLNAQSALAECRLAEAIITDGQMLQGLLLLDTCVEELRGPETLAYFVNFRGSVLDRIGVNTRAINDLETAVRLQPGNVEYALSLGHAWLKREESDKALATFRTALRLAPGNADVLSGLGSSWFEKGELTRASAFIQRALDIEPSHALALRDRGRIFLLGYQSSRAMEDFTRAMETAPERWDLFLYRGIANFYGARIDDALKDFNAANTLDPNNPRILVNRGEVLGQTGRTEEALADFTTAIEINPGTVEAWYGRGLLGARIAGDDPEMMKLVRSDLKQAITLDPGNARLEAAMSILRPEEPEEDKKRY